jgi:hypothetical protein
MNVNELSDLQTLISEALHIDDKIKIIVGCLTPGAQWTVSYPDAGEHTSFTLSKDQKDMLKKRMLKDLESQKLDQERQIRNIVRNPSDEK